MTGGEIYTILGISWEKGGSTPRHKNRQINFADLLKGFVLKKLEARQFYPGLDVNCYCGKITPQEKENLKAELKSFLSSEEFLTEYLPYACENCVSPDSLSVPEHMPDIIIHFSSKGATTARWMSEAMYYDVPYRSDQIMEIDNYQTWSDLDYVKNAEQENT